MRASEWQFLCAVHESPKSCCAIDYCCHTLDWATNIVTSQKIFPSRLSLAAGDSADDRGAGVKHLINIFRRLHRIFAHAWFQHRGVFWKVEGQTGLYVLFKTVCDNYELLPAENYKLPPEAEGLEPTPDVKAVTPIILKSQASSDNLSTIDEDFIGVGRTNTRRHIRQSPSVGSAVTTVLESDEEDPDLTQKLGEITLAEEEEENESGADIPVIVETYEVDENHEAGLEQPYPEQAEPVDLHSKAEDDFVARLASSSLERMSSGTFEDAELPRNAGTVVEKAESVGRVSEAVPTLETQSGVEEESETKQLVSAEETMEDEEVGK